MENSKLLTILVEVDEGHKTPIKAYNEIMGLFDVSNSLNTFMVYYRKEFNTYNKQGIEKVITDYLNNR